MSVCVGEGMAGQAATAAQVTSGEVASITGTLTYKVTACKCCNGGTDDSKV